MIIDTHIHLDDKSYVDDLDDVIERAQTQEVKGALIPGADPKDLPRAVEICEKYDNIFFAVGVHPYHATDLDIEYLKSFASHPKCIAVGECGLDYYRLPEGEEAKIAEKQMQKEVFIAQIELAIELDKPLIIHIRDASFDSKTILIENDAKKVGGVLHCYNASDILLELDSHGFYFGIGGVLTFKNAKKLVEVLPKIPLEKILLETDGPYLTPHPHRGKRNEPAYTKLVLSKISELLNINEDRLELMINKNTNSLFKEFS
ncbi:MAG TPA: TatD family deoxyribonuclease [Campylobacterales bacterium]|nr:TatD family deoxyribonuclease [Campylobacterales bacterium]